MRFGVRGHDGLARLRILSTVIGLGLLGARAPGLAAESSPIERAFDSAVTISVTLHWADGTPDAEFTGSGWTRECRPDGGSFDLDIATAGHVFDVPALEQEARPGGHGQSGVKVVVAYRDGPRYTAGRGDLRVDRVHDYGEVHILSPVARVVLPAGGAGEGAPGTHVFSVASPGLLTYAYFEGSISTLDAHLVGGAPEGALLASLPVAPGASGAPVLTDDGHVIAFVDGYVEWPWGARASVLVALPPEISPAAHTYNTMQEGMEMGLLETLFPFVKLTGAAAVGIALVAVIKPLIRGRGMQFGADALDIVMAIAEKTVMAVEQAHGDLAGVDKKQLATETVGEILSRLGIQPPQALVDAAIEAAVLTMNRVGGKAA